MPTKQGEDKTILENIGFWAKFFLTSIVGALLTYSLARQGREEERQVTRMENQNKINTEVSRALDKLEGTQYYLRRDLDANDKKDEKQEEEIDNLKNHHR